MKQFWEHLGVLGRLQIGDALAGKVGAFGVVLWHLVQTLQVDYFQALRNRRLQRSRSNELLSHHWRIGDERGTTYYE